MARYKINIRLYLIWSSNIEEIARRLDMLFKALHARNLKINPKKCVFGTTKLTFAGYCLTGEEIYPDKSKVDAVNNAKTLYSLCVNGVE